MALSDVKARLAQIALRAPIPAAAGGDAAAAPSPVPVIEAPHEARGVDLDVTIPPERVPDAARLLDGEGFMLEAITGVDWLAEGQIEIVYDYTLPASGVRVAVRARVPRDKPELPTLSGLHPGANWHEREAHDFFGVVFTGHPDVTPLLLPEDADFHPLRKDYSA